MGLFFEDPKPPAPPPPPQIVKKDGGAALIDGLFAVCLIVLVAVFNVLTHIFKPLLTFEGKSRQQINTQLAIAALLVLVPLYFVYQIPRVRDFISLKTTTTINYTRDGQRIFFPDRSLFVPTESRRSFVYDSKTYITYAGYTRYLMQKMFSKQCQLVTRGESMGFASIEPPLQAEGFEDEVTYTIAHSLYDLSGTKYVFYMLIRPHLWLKSKETLISTRIEREVTTSWKELVDNWSNVWSPSSLGEYKPFEVTALSREHAIACF